MKKFKIAVVGCGGMSNIWVKYALSRENTNIVALVDIDKENAENMRQKYGLHCEIYSDVSEAIKDSGTNLVFNITIPDAHRDIAISALTLGCDVLSEKPIQNSKPD
ncbi:unnamed protein product [marine sediment metagenome]|uniref:Gfo/Idh/MocA-like oxidoreductase N-terminal domain-containing protein n=1 Tax=marine sediment metagenome TaxID=412755 RepID=X1JBN7_9ZZZZ